MKSIEFIQSLTDCQLQLISDIMELNKFRYLTVSENGILRAHREMPHHLKAGDMKLFASDGFISLFGFGWGTSICEDRETVYEINDKKIEVVKWKR